jgi:hypothetical protein
MATITPTASRPAATRAGTPLDSGSTLVAGGIQYIFWLMLIGVSRSTGWRWRKPGSHGEPPRVKCCRIDRTWYITIAEIDRFWRRAQEGEFSAEDAGICARGEVS